MSRPKGSKNKPKPGKVIQLRPGQAAGETADIMPAGQSAEVAVATITDAAAMPICHDVFAVDLDEVNDGEGERASINLKTRYLRQNPEARAAAQAKFLSAFQQTARIDLACKAAGVTYGMFRAWREFGGRFREKFEISKEYVIALLESRLAQLTWREESVANRQMFQSVIAQLNAMFPEKYRPKQSMDVTHHVVKDYVGFGGKK